MDSANKETAMQKMTTAEARKIFEDIIATSETPEQADDRRLVMEFFCNPAFRAAMTAEVRREVERPSK